MGIHEECGVFGVMNKKKEPVAELVYYGLYALQHRGQESCGIVVNDDGVFSSYKDLGLVSEVFSKDTLSHLPEGTIAVGHVRWKSEQCSGASRQAGVVRSYFSYHQRYGNHRIYYYQRTAEDTQY